MDTDPAGYLQSLIREFDAASGAIVEEFKRPWGNEPAPAVIYHYTNDAGLRGILENGKIWLNDLFQMNDPSELRHGVEHAIAVTQAMARGGSPEMQFFAEHFARIKTTGIERSAHYFVASFSHNGDELGQWRAYADDGHGFALGFDGNPFEQAFAKPGDPAGEGNLTFPVRYNDAELRLLQEKIIALVEPLIVAPSGKDFPADLLRKFLRDLSVAFSVAIFHSALYFKHHAYKPEEEYRFLNIQPGDKPPRAVLSRPRPYGLLRFIEFDWRNLVPGALREIVIGPAADEDRARSFIGTCLDVFGYDPAAVKVTKSPMPYRSPRR